MSRPTTHRMELTLPVTLEFSVPGSFAETEEAWAQLDFTDAYVDQGFPNSEGKKRCAYLKVARHEDETRHRIYCKIAPGQELAIRKGDKHTKGMSWAVRKVKPIKVGRGFWIWRVSLEVKA